MQDTQNTPLCSKHHTYKGVDCQHRCVTNEQNCKHTSLFHCEFHYPSPECEGPGLGVLSGLGTLHRHRARPNQILSTLVLHSSIQRYMCKQLLLCRQKQSCACLIPTEATDYAAEWMLCLHQRLLIVVVQVFAVGEAPDF